MYPHRQLYWELIQGKINQVKFSRNLFKVASLDKRFTMALADIGLLYPVQHERRGTSVSSRARNKQKMFVNQFAK